MSNAVKVALIIGVTVVVVVTICCVGLLALAQIAPPTAPIPSVSIAR